MKVLFFASLKERVDCDQIELEASPALNTAQAVLDTLIAKGEPWASALQAGKVLIAVNQEMAKLSTSVTDADEIAFFPPVTGG